MTGAVIHGPWLTPDERQLVTDDFLGWLAARKDPSLLIADCGHPRWPGWQMLLLLLIAIQIWIALNPSTVLLRTGRAPRRGDEIRISRTVGAGRGGAARNANAVRLHTQERIL